MTWFNAYAAFGAPALIFIVCYAVVTFERHRRATTSLSEAAGNIDNRLDRIDSTAMLYRLASEADITLKRQAEIAASLHAGTSRRIIAQVQALHLKHEGRL